MFDDNLKQQLRERIELQDDKIEMKDLILVDLIYKSDNANFYICLNNNNSKLYVLKSMLRNSIIYSGLQKAVVTEKKLLSQMDCNLIVKLVKTFKDSKRLCMLLEYVKGTNLPLALKALKKPDELDYRFYAGCLLLIIEYLHEHDIIYRDLNKKNIMIDTQGYPKLLNFSSSKYLEGRTFTLVGTPHYVAPEVITGHGYGMLADYWSLGVILYEIMYGVLPFGNNEIDPANIYRDIINHRLVFPSKVDPLSKSRDFISILLSKTPTLRTTIDKLKTHPWFVGLNWDFLINKQIKAPYLPVARDLDDLIHTAVKKKIFAEEYLPNIENSAENIIPRFNVNTKWDAEF